ncbi:MAG TPA: phenylpyruvate tautomerase MIF-related protein [Polyangia bacterium]
MPLLQLSTSAYPADEPKRARLLKGLSSLVARLLGKPESYVMISLTARAEISFAGSSAPACYAELKNVGTLSGSQTEELSKVLCQELSAGLGVPPERIYIEFTNADGAMWGWNGGTFG